MAELFFEQRAYWTKFQNYLLLLVQLQPLSLLGHLLTPEVEEVGWISVEFQSILAIIPSKQKSTHYC